MDGVIVVERIVILDDRSLDDHELNDPDSEVLARRYRGSGLRRGRQGMERNGLESSILK